MDSNKTPLLILKAQLKILDEREQVIFDNWMEDPTNKTLFERLSDPKRRKELYNLTKNIDFEGAKRRALERFEKFINKQ